MNLRISHPSGHLEGTFRLPASKSESNRALIIQALSQGRCNIENLSEAEDTRILAKLLAENPYEMNVGHAGTAMRFLTAYLAFRPEDKVLTGSARMQERPIGILVEALRKMGADIQYLDREGFPPLAIYGRNSAWGEDDITVPGNISSQFITALLLIAPTMPDGLRLTIEGECGSWPYVEMTLAMMEQLGVKAKRAGNRIEVDRQLYQGGTFEVESDWSAASYAFVAAGLSRSAKVLLPGLKPTSLQGDAIVKTLCEPLGIKAEWTDSGLLLKKDAITLPDVMEFDFNDCPDLAQGMMVLLAGLGVEGRLSGLSSLHIKETDRLYAMQTELNKIGVNLQETSNDQWRLTGKARATEEVIQTYADHRMAMAFAPISLLIPGLQIQSPEVVGKSFPGYWKEMEALGFRCEEG